jgi:thiamine-monophosphate kinase
VSSPRLPAEDQLIAWLRGLEASGRLGDDTAQIEDLGPVAISVDQQIAGTHFPADLDPAWVARRLLEVCLSDLAASAARPRCAFLAVAAPSGWDHRRFFRALDRACLSRGIELAGGDVARSAGLVLSLTVLGARPEGGRWTRRSNGRPGDHLWLGGPVGLSALGRRLVERGARPRGRGIELPAELASAAPLARAARRAVRAHLAPTAQIELGLWLGRQRRAAAIDVSDGLALDLARLCRESAAGAVIDLEALPVDPRLDALARHLGLDALEQALSGGEDYVLLFALPPTVPPPRSAGCTSIGRLTEGPGMRVAGSDRELAPTGWSHL